MARGYRFFRALAVISLLASAGPLTAANPAPGEVEFFEKKVRPVLVEHCYKCHSTEAKKPKGGLLLDSREALLKGGDSGPAVIPGQPDKSRILEAVRYQNVDLRMPPRGKLPDAVIADLTRWVQTGAPWPHEIASQGAKVVKEEFNLRQRKRRHWAWQPVRPQTPPPVANAAWALQPVDRFILARLEAKGLTPAPPADRRTLLRRLSFDLIGLPPTPEELDAFLRDSSPDALEKVVDRLLASPHFGERWARHWLDLARYAETRGHEFDYVIPNAYQYRDYIIRALNADLPYNCFVEEHVAGDLLPRPRLHPTAGFNESILGTGFWFLGEEVHSPVDTGQDEADRLDNKIDVLTKTFLGLTVACARCHDHKFDAISTRDYYALAGFLESSGYRLARFDTLEHNRGIARNLEQLRERSRPPIQRALAESLRPGVDRIADYLLAAREVLAASEPPPPLDEVARSRHLDAALLGDWVAHLGRAARDTHDPVHAWALVARAPGAPRQVLQSLLDGGRRREAEAKVALDGADVVVDYRRADPAAWMPDGVTFGSGPARPGEVRFSDNPARPIAALCEHAAAEKDPTWDRLRPAPGSEFDPGVLGEVPRAGRSLRTPSFPLTTGKVYYLVRGNGRAYAAVDSHALIAGPLHGRLIARFNTGSQFQWVAHDLGPYKGHRTFIEFTPIPGADFAVRMIVQGSGMPAPVDQPGRALRSVLAEAGSSETLAAGYQRLFREATDRLAADTIIGAADAAEYAGLANWMIRHADLLAVDRAGCRHLTRAAAPFFAARTSLLAQVRDESRLAPAMMDNRGVDEHVFIRGSPKNLGDKVPRRFLEALAGPEPLAIARGSGRLELARQMTDPTLNPLIARVLVNRVWHHLFGRGIVASVDNFGVLGEPPSHSELLDYLADEFVRQGWSIKKLIRSLALSSTYRMSSRPDDHADQADPQNVLLHRMRLRRLEGEAIRDAMLAVSERLDQRLYGPPVPVYLTSFQDGRGRPLSGPLDGAGRRSLYLTVRRNFLSSMLLAFDTPIPFSTVGRRTVSNVPAQALILMNDPFVHQQAKFWAQRVLDPSGPVEERIRRMYLSAFGRPPTMTEFSRCLAFLKEQRSDGSELAAWTDLAHVLFNVKDFIFLN
jgi:hypothetical protein